MKNNRNIIDSVTKFIFKIKFATSSMTKTEETATAYIADVTAIATCVLKNKLKHIAIKAELVNPTKPKKAL